MTPDQIRMIPGERAEEIEAVCRLADDSPALAPLRTLPLAVQTRLALLARARAFPDGQVLLQEGESAGNTYLILSGTVRLERADGVPVTAGPGTICGGLSDAATARQPFTVRAVGDVETLTLSHLALGLIMLHYPEVAATLLTALQG